MLALLFIALAIPGLIQAEIDQRIVGGENANIANHPYQCSLRNVGTHTCGCVLISATRALTAAHCGGGATSSYSVLAGTSERTVQTCATCALRNPVTNVVRHPNFANNPAVGYPNDIAILWFYSIAKNTNIDYIEMATSSDGSFVGQSCVVTGWGRQTAGGTLPTTLQDGKMTVTSNADCIAVWGANRIRDDQLCAIESSTAVCGGDNGGPIVCGGKLAGIFSWGEANCSTAFPAVFARISSYVDWVNGPHTSN